MRTPPGWSDSDWKHIEATYGEDAANITAEQLREIRERWRMQAPVVKPKAPWWRSFAHDAQMRWWRFWRRP